MSRRALWQPSAPVSAAPAPNGPAPQAPSSPPTGAPSSIPPRSAIDAQVKLARLADVLSEAAGIVRELAQVPLDDARDSRLMSHVETITTHPRLLSIKDVAERLQLDARTVRRMRTRGQLPPAIDLHSVLRWDEATIDAWIEGRREQ